jgi:hypothetical protein
LGVQGLFAEAAKGQAMTDLSTMTTAEILKLFAEIPNELRKRQIVRSENITGDVAEYLFCRAFPSWTHSANSQAHYDAVDGDVYYQIKGRRPTKRNKSPELGAIRDMDGRHFTFLAGLIFKEDFTVERAALVPHAVVKKRGKYVARSNSHKFLLKDNVWEEPGVDDVTKYLIKAASVFDEPPQ